ISLKIKALNAGVSVSDTTSDHKVAVAMVNANCRKNWPEIPSRNAVGMNTPASTSTIEIKAVPTSSIVLCTASRGFMPSSMFREASSTTTMASSTTIPMASTKPNSVRLLSEKPKRLIMVNVPINEIGIASIGMIDARNDCRKSTMTITTKIMASKIVLYTSSSDCSTYSVGLYKIL